MATILKPPFDLEQDHTTASNYLQAMDGYIEKLREHLRVTGKATKPVVGKILRYRVADSYAMYMVTSADVGEVVLWHLPVMDGYRAHRLIEKGIDENEVLSQPDLIKY